MFAHAKTQFPFVVHKLRQPDRDCLKTDVSDVPRLMNDASVVPKLPLRFGLYHTAEHVVRMVGGSTSQGIGIRSIVEGELRSNKGNFYGYEPVVGDCTNHPLLAD